MIGPNKTIKTEKNALKFMFGFKLIAYDNCTLDLITKIYKSNNDPKF